MKFHWEFEAQVRDSVLFCLMFFMLPISERVSVIFVL